MLRLVFVVAVAISLQLVLPLSAAMAQEARSSLEPQENMRGMIVLKFPFGGDETYSGPRVGFDFQMQSRNDLDQLWESYEPKTGRRLPEIDTDRMRTWSLELPEFSLPEDDVGESRRDAPRIIAPHAG